MANIKKAFVCGHPIKHSRSPLIHQYWIDKYELGGSYERIDVSPEHLEQFLSGLIQEGFSGGNFTIPHKENVFAHIAEKDADATAIGAVNTVWIENGKLCGGNTDAYGFAANLDDQIPEWRQAERALIFGAGGASRAVIYALGKAGIKHIDLVNRTLSRAETLAEEFGQHVKPYGWESLPEILPSADLTINASSIGMNNDDEFPVNLSSVKKTAFAADIVYTPLKTSFLKAAEKQGLSISDGIGMLLHQAVPGFEKWFGIRPEVDDKLRKMILDNIEAGKH